MKISISYLSRFVIFCAALLVIRHFKTDHYSFLFLLWNLFLAWLPLFFIRRTSMYQNKLKRIALLWLSILFLPNAPYILTDLFHLKKTLIAPLWFDLVLILSFAILGLIYFIMALELILKEITLDFPVYIQKLSKPFLFLSSGYGIYLGRYLRFNSWDVVSQPFHLAGSMYNSIFNPLCFKETMAVTITFTIFLYLIFEIYLSFKKKNLTTAQ
ncbi:MAG: DUF1361 domain-containing protein [Bacteroidia bacterium]